MREYSTRLIYQLYRDWDLSSQNYIDLIYQAINVPTKIIKFIKYVNKVVFDMSILYPSKIAFCFRP